MTRSITLALLVSMAMFAACTGGGGTENAPQTGASSPAATEDTPDNEVVAGDGEAAKPDAPASGLTPDSVKPGEAVDAGELKVAVAADPEGWTGKEVLISGKNDGQSVSQVKTGQVVDISVAPTSGGPLAATCRGTVDPGKEALNATKFKGTIKEFNYGRVILEPCGVAK